ncbi:MAG: hypothetical protein CL943_01060 [Candidatus Diapherotrites archaeon]|uniref:Uncharacterized protein n=1 Tax=Candidatus Iainarchaeum sp. TaxID=3101447 RepID=A0A2D6M0C6_9ARCH|nr:hypothetical protein [Candidatus Diapherotrites archaeon]|tara:strand:- start:5886 stop:6101 length:216 start_codon:yes stop_codon:yes gene_type:complete
MGEDKKNEPKQDEGRWYNIALHSIRFFVFAFILLLAAYTQGFTELKPMVSLQGAVILFAASVIVSFVENLA